MIDIDEYESLLYDWKIRLTKEGVEEAKAHWFHENGEGLLAEVKRLREGRLDLINEVIRIINNKTGERVDADLHDYIIDRLVNE